MPTTRADLRAILAGSRLPAFDGVRAVCVVVVIASHFGYSVPSDLGVSAFFVLSGMLITWLLLRERDSTGETSLGSFYLRRTLRIFPAYYAYVLFAIAWDFLRGDRWTAALLGSALAYLMNYYNAINGHPTTSVAHAWSLAVEEQFYLLWPLAFLLIASRAPQRMAAILVGVTVAACAWRAFAYLGLGATPAYVYNAFETRIDNVAIGCLIAVLARRDSFLRVVDSLSPGAWAPLATVGALLVSRFLIGEAWHHSFGYTVNAVLIGLLLLQLLHWHASPLWRWLESGPARYIGLVSYPMYLYHAHAMGLAQKLPAPALVQLVLSVLLAIAAGTLSYRVVEKPILSLRRHLEPRLLARKPAIIAAQPAA